MKTRNGFNGKVLAVALSLALAVVFCPLGAYGQEDGAASGTQGTDTASAAPTPAGTAAPSVSDSSIPQQDAVLAAQPDATPTLQPDAALVSQQDAALAAQSVTDPTGLVYSIDSSGGYGAGAYVTGYTGESMSLTVPAQLGGANVVSVQLPSSGISLTFLDVSGNTALKYCDCSGISLTSLDVSGDTALTELYCKSNSLTSLDVTQDTALQTLDCGGNALPSLDVTQNTALENLGCEYNSLTSLDISRNTALKKLNCQNNSIIDISALIAWLHASGHSGQVTPQNTINLSSAVISPIPDQTNTGNAQCPAMTVTLRGVVLADGIDYKSSYTGNTAVGTATATVVGIGRFTGTVSTTFNIVSPVQKAPDITGTVPTTFNTVSSGQKSPDADVASVSVLPKTGDAYLLPIIVGAVLLLAGAGCLLIACRRRSHR